MSVINAHKDMYVCYTWGLRVYVCLLYLYTHTHTHTHTHTTEHTYTHTHLHKHTSVRTCHVCYIYIYIYREPCRYISSPVDARILRTRCAHVAYTLRTPPTTGASGTALNEATVDAEEGYSNSKPSRERGACAGDECAMPRSHLYVTTRS